MVIFHNISLKDLYYTLFYIYVIYFMIWYIYLQLGWHLVAGVQYTFTHKQYTEQHNRHKQYTEQHNSLTGICVIRENRNLHQQHCVKLKSCMYPFCSSTADYVKKKGKQGISLYSVPCSVWYSCSVWYFKVFAAIRKKDFSLHLIC
jgi:hypothetical protein